MLLKDKIAVIYGAGGPIGGEVARAFVRGGASVFLAGRTLKKLDKVAAGIRAAGGNVETAAFDALDEQAVDDFADGVAKKAGRIDVSMNVIGYGDVQEPLMEISVEEFVRPIQNAMRTQFLTTRAAARHMIKGGGGVILHFGGGGPQTLPGLGGFKVALDAIEGLRRQWALELGKHGIRVVTLRTGASSMRYQPSFPAGTPSSKASSTKHNSAERPCWRMSAMSPPGWPPTRRAR
jgi:3-oxoacyl-[acyl-carrier protein] reductase